MLIIKKKEKKSITKAEEIGTGAGAEARGDRNQLALFKLKIERKCGAQQDARFRKEMEEEEQEEEEKTPGWTLQFQFLGMPAGRRDGQTIEQLLLETLAI